MIGPLTEAPRGTVVATLGDLRATGHRLHGFCDACGKCGYLDMDALIARYGASRSFLKGALTLRCSCGARADYHLHQPQQSSSR